MITDRLPLTDPDFDRAGLLRTDEAALARLRAHPHARVLPVIADSHPVDDGFAPVSLGVEDAFSRYGEEAAFVFLGLDSHRNNAPVFAIDGGERLPDEVNEDPSLQPLRMIASAVPERDAHLLAYARALIYWHREHRHCPRCGTASISAAGGHQRVCGDEACGRIAYPRTDPATIMLIEHPTDDAILLGRQSAWPEQMMSVLAGFVEPGESLEDCVRREVFEESAIRVGTVRYVGSQPWPFPSSLMAGFFGKAETQDITIDPLEIEAARWVSRAEVTAAATIGSQQDAALFLPPRLSISRRLVDHWLAGARP